MSAMVEPPRGVDGQRESPAKLDTYELKEAIKYGKD